MKKAVIFLWVLALAVFSSACSANRTTAPPENSTSYEEAENTGETLTEEYVTKLFLSKADSAFTVTDCVLADNRSYDIIGVVQFTDENGKACNLAFVKEDGYFQRVGFDAQISDDSTLTYMGNASVSLILKNINSDEKYIQTVKYSAEDGNVNFTAASEPII